MRLSKHPLAVARLSAQLPHLFRPVPYRGYLGLTDSYAAASTPYSVAMASRKAMSTGGAGTGLATAVWRSVSPECTSSRKQPAHCFGLSQLCPGYGAFLCGFLFLCGVWAVRRAVVLRLSKLRHCLLLSPRILLRGLLCHVSIYATHPMGTQTSGTRICPLRFVYLFLLV
mgnify:CR=1 FL=1